MSGNGALGWASRMIRMDVAYDVSVLQSCVNTSTVKYLKYYNAVAKRVIQSASDSYLLYTTWKHDVSHPYMQIITDASFRNREDHKTQGGQIIRFASQEHPGGVGNIIDYQSKKIGRAVKSRRRFQPCVRY